MLGLPLPRRPPVLVMEASSISVTSFMPGDMPT